MSRALLLFATFAFPNLSLAQQQSFVTGVIPVIGRNGAVGGVQVTVDGVVQRADVDATGKLRQARIDAMKELPREVARFAQLRKVSLRRLEQTIARHMQQNLPLTEEIENLAGLQRVSYVLLYPDDRDIVLAGSAEGWKVDSLGNLVGLSTERPVLQLADLLVAMRSAENALGAGMTCSIDPTDEGLARVQQLLSRRLQPNAATIAALRRAVGSQQVTIKGVDPDTHFARVMLAADVVMKRLAMNFEPAPVRDMPSYLHLLRTARGPAPQHLVPRWWLAPDYEPLLHSEDKLAWEVRGPGVQAMTDQEVLDRNGAAARSDVPHPAAQQWADSMTANYDELSASMPVFGELRNCMDLAVVAALIIEHNLTTKADCDLPLLFDSSDITVAKFHIPQTIKSQASVLRKGRAWIVSISGGVEMSLEPIVRNTQLDASLSKKRTTCSVADNANWWWD